MSRCHPRIASPLRATVLAAAFVTTSLVTSGCEWDDGPTTPCTAGGPGTTIPAPCDPDPLRTSLDPLWNGNSVDAYDCPILEFTASTASPTP